MFEVPSWRALDMMVLWSGSNLGALRSASSDCLSHLDASEHDVLGAVNSTPWAKYVP
ncbi:hypothetical protein PI125_g19308 [Phytophthora idaei]|nr:hypothetical protein PI125_g19308 [Phytophthora idaei]